MKKKKTLIIIITIILLADILIFSISNTKYRDYNFSGSFRYNFTNPEGKIASALIFFNDNGIFEYREQAGRGITIFSGNYLIDKTEIKFINDNNVSRSFNYSLNKNRLSIKTINFNQQSASSFHIQPVLADLEISYFRLNYKALDLEKSKKIDKTYVYFLGNKKFKLVFKTDNTFNYSVKINNSQIEIVGGKYFLTNESLIIEDEKGIRFNFSLKNDDKGIYLKKKSANFLAPFLNTDVTLKFLKYD
jgi:hypothetical protein